MGENSAGYSEENEVGLLLKLALGCESLFRGGRVATSQSVLIQMSHPAVRNTIADQSVQQKWADSDFP